MDEVVIRRARFEDLRSVSEIVVASWKDAYRGIVDDEYLDGLTVEENYRRRAGNFTDDGFVVAEVNGEVVAFCRYVFENAYADRFPDVDCELCALYVKPDCKGDGIGKRLIRFVMQDFKDRGYRRMLLWCFKDNFPARVFYEKMGGVYGGTGVVSRGGKDYDEVCYVYDLERFPKEELVLVFPKYEYKEQIEEYAKEFYDNGEMHIPGCGGLDRLDSFDEWLEKVQNDVSAETVCEGRVPATFYLTVRKSDGRIVGNVQVRHGLNEKLLNYGGHIGDAVRPSERRKGYATEQIRLALLKCKELGIDNVLMDCDKANVGSARSIQNNGGVLENEVLVDGALVQRYWISLKKRFAFKHLGGDRSVRCKSLSVESDEFSGDVYFYYFKNVDERYVLPSGVCLIDDDYKWLEFYDYGSKFKLSMMYNEKNEPIEWYFDVARRIGNDNGFAFEDDLYLDVLVTSDGEVKLLDRDEFDEAHDRFEVSDEDYEIGLREANELIERLEGCREGLRDFTDKYLHKFMRDFDN